MRRIRKQAAVAVGAVTLAMVGLTALQAAPASAGPCYTITYDNGSPNPPSATICPFD